MNNGEGIIQLSYITKRFGMNEVLSKVCFDLRKGEVHALVGENGAGKTSILKAIQNGFKSSGHDINLIYNKADDDRAEILIELNDGMTVMDINNLIIDGDGYLYAGTRGGCVFRTAKTLDQ